MDYAFYCGKRMGGDYNPMNSGQAVKIRSAKVGGRVFIGDFPLIASAFSVCLPIPEAIISVMSFAVL